MNHYQRIKIGFEAQKSKETIARHTKNPLNKDLEVHLTSEKRQIQSRRAPITERLSSREKTIASRLKNHRQPRHVGTVPLCCNLFDPSNRLGSNYSSC